MKTGLLAIGLTTLDIVALPIDALTHTERARRIDAIACAPAGTAAGAALVAAKLGAPVRLAGAVGADMNGGFVKWGLEHVGVDTSLLEVRPGERTSTTVLAVESDGTRSSYHMPGAGGAPPVGAAVRAAAEAARFVHYAAVGGATTDGGPGLALLQAAKRSGAIVSCDLISPGPAAAAEIGRLLPYVDYFMPSAAEAFFLSGQSDLPAAAEHFLALGAGACIIKNGRSGALFATPQVQQLIPAFAVTAVDTTSCGDAFCAGFISALHRNWPPVAAARLASMVAGRVASAAGTLGALESFEAAAAAMDETPINAD